MLTQNEIYDFNLKVKHNKEGWPLGKAYFGLATIHKSLIGGLEKRLLERYNLRTFCVQLVAGEDYFKVYAGPVRLGVNEFAKIQAYVEGFRDGQIS